MWNQAIICIHWFPHHQGCFQCHFIFKKSCHHWIILAYFTESTKGLAYEESSFWYTIIEALECETLIRSMQNLKQQMRPWWYKKAEVPQAFVHWSQCLHESCYKRRCIFNLRFSFTNCWTCAHEILSRSQEFKDMFEKKNEDTLTKHWPYDCVVDFVQIT